MKKVNYLFLLTFFGFSLLTSCSSEDEPTPIEVSINSIPAISVDENPTNGDVLATLTGTVNRGDLVFSLSNQSPAGAMAIDSKTGQLTVADASKFDFETNPTLTATGNVEVEGVTKSATITVNLNNMPEVVSAPDVEFTIAENPTNGQAIGTILASTDAGTITYSISGKVSGVELSSSGELTVSAPVLFDYERSTRIIFDYEASNGVDAKIGKVTINITDVDERPIQTRLDGGETPLQIVNSGVTVDSLYAKTYKGGIIGSYTNGSVVIVAEDLVSSGRNYNQGRSDANSLVLNGFSDWRLPTKAETDAICSGIRSDTFGKFPSQSSLAWTTTTCGGICVNTFSFGTGSCGGGGTPNSNSGDVVAVRVTQ